MTAVLITLAQAKEHIRISSPLADKAVQVLLDGAESWLAETLGTRFTTGEVTCDLTPRKESLRPPALPIVEVDTITDLFTGDEVDAEDYRLGRGPSQLYERIIYGGAGSAPSWWPEGAGRYEVVYTAGYNNGDATKPEGSVAAPDGLKLVLLDLVARAWANRGGKQIETAAGIFVNWDSLAAGEIMARLAPFRLSSAM